MAVDKTVSIFIDDTFRVKVLNHDFTRRMELQLTRRQAQQLGEKLLEFASAYGNATGRKALFAGDEVADR